MAEKWTEFIDELDMGYDSKEGVKSTVSKCSIVFWHTRVSIYRKTRR